MTRTSIHPIAVETAEFVDGVKNFDPGLGSYNFDNLGDLVRFADLMAKSDVMIPEYLRNKAPICLGIAMRATHWKMDPFGLANESYQTKPGQPIGYQAKVFVAALKNCTGIQLQYRFEGSYRVDNVPTASAKGNEVSKRSSSGDRKCIAFATVNGLLLEYETPTINDITIKNSALWINDPDQALSYYAGRGWTRRHEPGVMLGAYSMDEVRDMSPIRDVTPEPRKQNPFAAIAQKAREAMLAEHAQVATGENQAQQADTAQADDAHWTDGYDPVNGIPGSKEWAWGMESAKDPEHTVRACPFERGSQEGDDWLGGFIGARRASE